MFGHKKKHHRTYNDQVMPDNMTPGQVFDVADATSDVFRGIQGNGVIGWQTGAFAGLDLAISAGSAAPGKMGGRVAGALTAQVGGIASYYAAKTFGGIIGRFVGGTVGGLVGGAPGAAAGAYAGGKIGSWSKFVAPMFFDPLTRKISRPVDRAVQMAQHQVHFGGLQDSQPAYTMRQRALQEMRGSLLNAKQYMGREAQLMHQ